ncbi:unnamed protein product, partial [Meganyctiphanes norvegica]
MAQFTAPLHVMRFVFLFVCYNTIRCSFHQDLIKHPTILVVILARNKAHTLPYFLTMFEQLNYPKDRMSLFIRSDHNQDKTITILEDWVLLNQHKYHSANVRLDKKSEVAYSTEKSPVEWTEPRFKHMIKLKEQALNHGRKNWVDYVWYLDCDVFLSNPNILRLLIMEDKPIFAPMLKSLATYSNFWGGMAEDYWYKRTDEYIPILERKEKGCFAVPMVHSCFLVDLTRQASDLLTFNPQNISGFEDIPEDDIIAFALSAASIGMDMYVCNMDIYGYIPPPVDEDQQLELDFRQLLSIKLEMLVEYPEVPVSPLLEKYTPALPAKDKMGFSHQYLINLNRRPDRRERMEKSFKLLGLDVEHWSAVDGKLLNDSYLQGLGVFQMDAYKDPWSKRDMTYGEIGCFLSHYYVWEDIVKNGYKEVIVFEDDIRFEPYFREKIIYIMKEAKELTDEWDLIYVGRKKLKNADETWVEGADMLVNVDYSYWTLCYIITHRGASKLLAGKPLGRMVPVDEYLPIMFDKHPEDEWKSYFSPRDLKAFSASPLVVFPIRYTGEEGHISDTEESELIDETLGASSELFDEVVDAKGAMDIELGLNGLTKDEL